MSWKKKYLSSQMFTNGIKTADYSKEKKSCVRFLQENSLFKIMKFEHPN